MTTLLGAGLAVLIAGTANAEQFTVDPGVVPADFAHVSGGGSVIVDFVTFGESAVLESDDPGSIFTALNYQLSTTGTPAAYTFNDAFTLTVTFKGYGPQEVGTTVPIVFNGTITGTLNGTQNNVQVDVTPQILDFNLGSVPMHLDQYQKSGATLNAPAGQGYGGISFHAGSPIPEPGSMALLAMGALPVLGMIRRRRK